jgi:hypothetical protein
MSFFERGGLMQPQRKTEGGGRTVPAFQKSENDLQWIEADPFDASIKKRRNLEYRDEDSNFGRSERWDFVPSFSPNIVFVRSVQEVHVLSLLQVSEQTTAIE